MGRVIQPDGLMRMSAKGPRRPTPFRLGSHGIFERVGIVLTHATFENNAIAFAFEVAASFPLASHSFDDEFAGTGLMIDGAKIGGRCAIVRIIFVWCIHVCVF